MRRRSWQMLLSLVWVGIVLDPVGVPGPTRVDAGPSVKAGATLRGADPRHIVLEWTAPAYDVVEEVQDGRPVQRFTMPGCEPAGQPGEPELPVCTVLLGVPPAVRLDLHIVEAESVPVPGASALPPRPEPVVEEKLPPTPPDGIQIVGERRVEGPAYSSDELFPLQMAALGEPAFLRHQRLVAVSFYPLQYRPRSGELVYHPRVQLEVVFSGYQEPMGLVAEPPDFERLLARTLLNYAQARGWRRTTPAPLDIPPVPPDPGWRIPVRQEGVYQLTYGQLQAAGLPVDTLDPRTLRLFRYGQEVAIRVTGEEDGRFDPPDIVLFYGQPVVGDRNTDTEVYWLTYGGPPGRRMSQRDGTPHGTATVPASFALTEHIEVNRAYYPQMPWRPDHDHWFWNMTFPELGVTRTTYLFPAHPLVVEGDTTTLRLHLYSWTGDATVNPDHHIRLSLNNTWVSELWWDGQVELTPTIAVSSTLLQPTGNTVRLENPGDTGAFAEIIFYDWLELGEHRLFTAEGDWLRWEGAAGQWEYHLAAFSEPAVLLLDVTDPDGPVEIVNAAAVPISSTYTLRFEDAVARTTVYRAVASGQWQQPGSIESAHPVDLLDPTNGADYLVITHGDFYTQAQALAAFRSGPGLRTLAVDVQDVYDLFAYGRHVPAAVHDFLAYAYANWAAPAAADVVLLGDGHYDPKNYLQSGAKNYVPPYLAWVDPWLGQTAADNRYVCLSGADALPDMHLGRLPANTATQAQVMVNKIIAYESAPPPGSWRQHALFVADDADPAGNFAASAEALLNGFYPAPYQAERIYLGVNYPYEWPSVIAHTAVITNTNNGQLLVIYEGHGGTNIWASEGLLRNADSANLANGPYLPVALPLSCNEGYYIMPTTNPNDFALAETFLRADGRGWVASWSPTGNGVSTGHGTLAEGFLRALLADDERQLGPATLAGKLRLFQSGAWLDLLDTYTLFGDPALEMPLLETDLRLQKTAQPSTLLPGDPLTFTLSLSNTGPATAHHVVLSDTLSPLLVSPTVTARGITLTERPSQRFAWDVADMVAGQAGTVTITVHVFAHAPTGLLTNQTLVATSASETDRQNNADQVSVLVIAGPPHDIAVSATPPALPADGASLALIHACVTDLAGNPVADGSAVHFSTDAGTFGDGSTHYDGATAQGVAEVFLRAASQVLTATVTVTSGQALARVAVPFASMAPYTITVAAEPRAIPLTGTAQITATVQDILGHAVQDGTAVTFTTSLGTITVTRTPTYGGLATTTLRGDGQAGLAMVTARSGNAAGATAVRIGSGADYTLTLAVAPTVLPADGQSQATITATLQRVDGQPITATHWVYFSTTLGEIPSRSLALGGTATVPLTAGTLPGKAVVVATSERASAQAEVHLVPGAPAHLVLTSSPPSVPVGGSTTLLVATVHDTWDNPVANGTLVSFSTDLGTITPTVAATQAGSAHTMLTSGPQAGTATVVARTVMVSATVAVPFLPQAAATLTLAVTPAILIADDVSTATLSAWVGDPFGNPVQDGAVVRWYTDLGRARPAESTTLLGWARATLQAGSTVGTATVRCQAGDMQAQGTVPIIAGPPATLLVTADPAVLLANGVSTATVTAYVWDAYGHPIAAGTAVTFATSLGTITPTTALAQDGRAHSILRSGTTMGRATVRAQSGPIWHQTQVDFILYRVYLPLISRGSAR